VREGQKAWIDEIKRVTGHSYSRIAKEIGVTPTTINRFMDDERSSHSLSATTEAKLTERYGKSPKPERHVTPVNNMSHVPIVGVVQAGLWQTDFVQYEYAAEEYVEVSPDPRYPYLQRAAFRVQGDSMDLLYPAGTVVLAVRFYDLGRPPKTGEKVIAVRQKDGVEEATLKQVEVREDGTVILWPRSSNPEYSQAIIAPNMDAILTFADDGAHPEVRIEALVVQSIRLE